MQIMQIVNCEVFFVLSVKEHFLSQLPSLLALVIDLFHVSKGVDQFKIIFRVLKYSNNLVGNSNLPGKGPSLLVGKMSQVRLIFFWKTLLYFFFIDKVPSSPRFIKQIFLKTLLFLKYSTKEYDIWTYILRLNGFWSNHWRL